MDEFVISVDRGDSSPRIVALNLYIHFSFFAVYFDTVRRWRYSVFFEIPVSSDASSLSLSCLHYW